MNDVDGAVFQNRLGAGERHGIGNFIGNVFFDRRRLALGGLHHHTAFARTDDGAFTGKSALLSIVVDTFKVIDPFILTTHAAEPLAAAAHAEITDAALDARIDGRNIDGIAAARAAGAVSGEAIGIDFRTGFQITQRTADVFSLPFRHHPATLVAFAVAPAAVIETKTGVAGGAKLVEHHNIMLRVFEAEKAGALDNSRIGFALIGIRQVEHAGEFDAFAIKIYFLCTHVELQNLSGSTRSSRSNSSNRLRCANILNDLDVWNDLNGVYALTVGKTSCPNKSICWY